MSRNRHHSWGVFLLSGLVSAAAASAGPILEYTFNDASLGTSSASSGTNTTALDFINASGNAANLFSAAGLGVGGDLIGHPNYGTDRAFDNTASSGMGNAAATNGGAARHAADLDDIDQLRSWTVSGWFKTTTEFKGYATLFSNWESNKGFRLTAEGTTGNDVQYYVDSTSVSGTNVGYNDTNKWVFFAVTYDGTQSSNNLRFYRGYRNDTEATGGDAEVVLTKSFNVNAGAMDSENALLYIGNRENLNRPFDGLLDNIRIFGGKASAADASGALTLSDLETLRAGDVHVIPEPATLAVLVLAGGAALQRRRRKA